MKGKQRMKSFVFIQCKLLVYFGTHCMTRRRELVITWLDDFLYMRSVFRHVYLLENYFLKVNF
jgi:hypothetical protein